MADCLGILAGAGDLPRRLAAACARAGRGCFVVAFEGQTRAEDVEGLPHAWSRLGAAGHTIALLKRAGAVDVVMVGAMKRPSLLMLKPDAKGAAILARIGLRALGDDGLLRAVAAELEREGFRLVGVSDVLAEAGDPPLLAPAGVLGRLAPDELAIRDIARGIEVALALGRVDVGQAVVVQQGLVLGVEAIEGTDALLARVGGLRREGPGGVLVKATKPGQDERLDLPTIGLATVQGAMAAGLRGISVRAGASLVVDRGAVIAAADAAGLFIHGWEPDPGEGA